MVNKIKAIGEVIVFMLKVLEKESDSESNVFSRGGTRWIDHFSNLCVCAWDFPSLCACVSYWKALNFISNVVFFMCCCEDAGYHRNWMKARGRGWGAGWRLIVTEYRCCVSLETHTHTHTFQSSLHTPIMHENMQDFTHSHTHSCSSTHDLNFNSQGRSALNLVY